MRACTVRITGGAPRYWYAKHIGKIFEVYEDNAQWPWPKYIVKKDYDAHMGGYRAIFKDDCEEVKDG